MWHLHRITAHRHFEEPRCTGSSRACGVHTLATGCRLAASFFLGKGSGERSEDEEGLRETDPHRTQIQTPPGSWPLPSPGGFRTVSILTTSALLLLLSISPSCLPNVAKEGGGEGMWPGRGSRARRNAFCSHREVKDSEVREHRGLILHDLLLARRKLEYRVLGPGLLQERLPGRLHVRHPHLPFQEIFPGSQFRAWARLSDGASLSVLGSHQ